MSGKSSIFALARMTIAASIAAVLLLSSAPTLAHTQEMPPIATPFATPDFHFSDPARDAEYWRLYRETERTASVFREAMDAARRALRLPLAAPGTPGWRQARAAVERAIVARRPARDATEALIYFIERESPRMTPEEAQQALAIYRVHQNSLRASSDILVDLLASLAGIRINQWPP